MKSKIDIYSGIPDLTDVRIKRLAKANLFGAIVIGLNAIGWGAGWFYTERYALSIFCFSYLLYAWLILRINNKGYYYRGYSILLLGLTVWLVLLVFVVSGPGLGYGGAAHANFIILAVASYYLFQGGRKSVQLSLTLFSLLAFFIFQFPPIYFEPIIKLPPEQNLIAASVAWVTVVLTTGVFLHWIRRDFIAYEASISYSNKRLASLAKSNIPESILNRMSNSKDISVRMFTESTIVLLDIENLDKLSGIFSTTQLTEYLNDFFGELDDVTFYMGMEKLNKKEFTYAAVAGLAKSDQNHAVEALDYAIKLQSVAEKYKHLVISIGVSSGPFSALIFSNIELIQDFWGAAVSEAALLQKQPPSSSIKLSESTHKMVADVFQTKPVKYLELDYWVLIQKEATTTF